MLHYDHVWSFDHWCLTCGTSRSDVEELKQQTLKWGKGRTKGSVNYGGISLVARRMKARDVDWIDHMIDAYFEYRAERKEKGAGDRALLDFWIAVLPHVSQTMDHKLSKGQRDKLKPAKNVSDASIAALARLEGRGDKK